MTFEVVAGEDDGGIRLDRFLSTRLEGVSRTSIQKALKAGLVTLGGRPLSANHKTRVGEVFCGSIPPPERLSAEPEDIPLDVVYEDDDLIIVDKPAGMVVHPAKGHAHDTLVNALLFKGKTLSDAGGDELRPGIVHRLDKDTTGLVAVAKNAVAHASLSAQLKSREMGREYLAVVKGTLKPPAGEISKPIGRHTVHRKKMTVSETRSSGAREARTLYETLEFFPGGFASLVRVRLKTGRTHQIRVHLASVGNPVMGDEVYGRQKSPLIARPALHAARLTLVHPSSGKTMTFEAPLPPDFEKLLVSLRSKTRQR